MKGADTTKATCDPTPDKPQELIDWARFDAMTDAERHQAALSDPGAQPFSTDH